MWYKWAKKEFLASCIGLVTSFCPETCVQELRDSYFDAANLNTCRQQFESTIKYSSNSEELNAALQHGNMMVAWSRQLQFMQYEHSVETDMTVKAQLMAVMKIKSNNSAQEIIILNYRLLPPISMANFHVETQSRIVQGTIRLQFPCLFILKTKWKGKVVSPFLWFSGCFTLITLHRNLNNRLLPLISMANFNVETQSRILQGTMELQFPCLLIRDFEVKTHIKITEFQTDKAPNPISSVHYFYLSASFFSKNLYLSYLGFVDPKTPIWAVA